MNEKLKSSLALFADNNLSLKKEFNWHNVMIKRLAALLYADDGRAVDAEAIRYSLELIKKKAGVFSMFRGSMTLCIATMLSLSKNPEQELQSALDIYDLMKKEGFWSSDYLAIAAYQIAACAEPGQYQRAVQRSKQFYDGMKSNHWFLTGNDDYIFAAMLGMSDMIVESGVDRIESLFGQLKPEFWSGNDVQSICQILVLSNQPSNSAYRVLQLRDAFKEKNLRMDRMYTMSSLGVLALLPYSADEIVEQVAEGVEYLREQKSKGFGAFSVTKQELLMLVAGLVASVGTNSIVENVVTANLSTSITNIIIAQQAAMAAAVTSAVAASNSSSSS